MRDPGKAGAVCFADHRWISGWIECKDGAQSNKVAVLCDGQLLAQVACTLPVDPRTSGAANRDLRGFLFRMPRSYWDGVEHEVRVRLTESDQDLEHSPIRFRYLDESRYIPFQSTTLIGVKVLCFAPHADDESFGCGGILALHARNGDAVKLVVLSDGARATRSGSTERNAYVRKREQEAERACELLGISDLEFWKLPDRELGEQPDLVDRIKALLEEYAPTLVYSLSPMEYHPDHRAAALALWNAIQASEWKGKVGFYEINRPLFVNTLVDISEVVELKRQACNIYQSQLENFPYTECALGLGRHRALTLPRPASHAEGLFLVTSEQIRSAPPDRFLAWQLLPQNMDARAAGLPVSVVLHVREYPLLLRGALESLVIQYRPPLEVLVMDESHAGAGDTVPAFENLLPIRYHRLPGSGDREQAFAEGFRRASGEAILFMNDFDLLSAGHLESLVTLFGLTGEGWAVIPDSGTSTSMDEEAGLGADGQVAASAQSMRLTIRDSSPSEGTEGPAFTSVLFGRAAIERVECCIGGLEAGSGKRTENVTVYLRRSRAPRGQPGATPLRAPQSIGQPPRDEAAVRCRIAELERELETLREGQPVGSGRKSKGIGAAVRFLKNFFTKSPR